MFRCIWHSRISKLRFRSTVGTAHGIHVWSLRSKFGILTAILCRKRAPSAIIDLYGPWIRTEAFSQRSKVTPIERTLTNEGWLPNHPGTYYVVMTWAPCYDAKKRSSSTGQSTQLKPYAVV